MSDLNTGAAGGQPTDGGGGSLNDIVVGAITFEQQGEGDPNWFDAEGDQGDGADQAGQANAAPKAAEPAQPQQPPPGYIAQEQMLQMLAHQQQYNQQALPQIVATAVAQALQAVGFQPPQAPAPADPYAAIDPNSPDADWQRMEIRNQILEQKLAKLEGRWNETEQTWQQQQQQAQQMNQQQQFVQQVSADVSKGVDWMLQGVADSPQSQALKAMAASAIDKEWHASGYTAQGYTKALQAVKPLIDSLAGQLKAPAPQQRQAPGSGQRPGQGPGPMNAAPQGFRDYNDFMNRGPFSVNSITSAIRGNGS